MSLLVRPGQVNNKPAFIALIHVVTTGQKHMRWYQISRFCFVSNVEIWTLLADVSEFWDDCWGGEIAQLGEEISFSLGSRSQ